MFFALIAFSTRKSNTFFFSESFAVLGTFKWWPNLYRLSILLDGRLDKKGTPESLLFSLNVLEQSGKLRHLNLMNIDTPHDIDLPFARRCKNLKSWRSMNHGFHFDELKPVIEAQKESLEMLDLRVYSSNNQMFSTLSKCPKLKTLILSGSSFSLRGLSLMQSLTTLDIQIPSDFQNQDLPAPHSLPNMKTLKIETYNDDASIIVSTVAACQNLQSLTVLLPDPEFTNDHIDQIIRNCPNVEILKLNTVYEKPNDVQKNFENLSAHCPKIQFLQLKNGLDIDPEILMQKHSSLIAIHSESGIIVNSKSKFEDIGDIIAQFGPTRKNEIQGIDFM
jgi:hypothetical protein